MDGKVSTVFNHICFPKMTDFSWLGTLQAVTYTVKVVVSKKWRKIDTLLLHTTNRKYHMIYPLVARMDRPYNTEIFGIKRLESLHYPVVLFV